MTAWHPLGPESGETGRSLYDNVNKLQRLTSSRQQHDEAPLKSLDGTTITVNNGETYTAASRSSIARRPARRLRRAAATLPLITIAVHARERAAGQLQIVTKVSLSLDPHATPDAANLPPTSNAPNAAA